MTTAADDNRLGILEGRLAEQSASLQELRADLRELNARLDAGLQQVNARIDTVSQQVNSRIDLLFLAMLGIGAAQIALLVTIVVRAG